MTAKLRTKACETELIKKQAHIYRIKAELCELLLPLENNERFTQPEWEALGEIYKATGEVLDKLDALSTFIEAIKP